MKWLLNKFVKFFFQGLLICIPMVLTYVVIRAVVLWLDSLVTFKIPGLGLLLILAGITLIGFLGNTFLTRNVISFFDKLLQKLPLVRIIYTSLKDLVTAFVGEQKKFNKAVLVTIDGATGIQRIGFVTQNDLSLLGYSEKVAVYFPDSYNFSGELLVVGKDNLTFLDLPGDEVMKLIVSGGVTDIRLKSKT